MKTTLRSIGLLLATFVAAGAFAATPTVEVTVRPASGGKAVHKATTDASGSFVLPTLPAGAYTLEFRTQRSPELVGKKFTLSIAGTRHMGSQGGIAGTSLVGGVAIDVEIAAKAKVVGEITTNASGEPRYWQPAILGSNLPGRWTSNPTAKPVFNVVNVPTDIIQKLQDKGVHM